MVPVGCCLISINYLPGSVFCTWVMTFDYSTKCHHVFICTDLLLFPSYLWDFYFLFHAWHMYVSIISEAFYVGSASLTDHTKPLSNAYNHNKAHKYINNPVQPPQTVKPSFVCNFLPSFPKTTFWKCHYWSLLPCFRPPSLWLECTAWAMSLRGRRV